MQVDLCNGRKTVVVMVVVVQLSQLNTFVKTLGFQWL